jgi:putative serine protease PepD
MSDSNADRGDSPASPDSIFFGPSTSQPDPIDASRAPRAPHPTSPPRWETASSMESTPPASPIAYPGEEATMTMPPPPRPAPAVAAASPQGTPPRRSWWAPVAAGFLGAVIAVGGMQLIDAVGSDDDPAPVETAAAVVVDTPAVPAPSIEIPLMTEGTVVDPVAVGSTVIPSVVTVEVGSASADGFFAQGTGSGVILDTAGHIATNDHVAAIGDDHQVILADGRVYDAQLIGTDPLTDLAVLKVTATDLVPIEFGAADDLTVGDPAVAVGSPLGLEGGPSLTVGVVSAFGRQVQTGAQSVLFGMLQTDAPITSGSSGGALVDSAGRLIGITTAVGVSEVGIEGIGFATPVELVERVTDELIAEGGIQHAFLGITGETAFEAIGIEGKLPIGVEVFTVDPGSAAAVAGLEAGDVITTVDGENISTMDELISMLRRYSAGQETTLVVDRAGTNDTFVVTLGVRPN